MSRSKITGFSIETRRESSGLLGRRTTVEELLRMDTPGGTIYLRESAVRGAGDSWTRVKRRMKNLAAEKHIPFSDETKK